VRENAMLNIPVSAVNQTIIAVKYYNFFLIALISPDARKKVLDRIAFKHSKDPIKWNIPEEVHVHLTVATLAPAPGLLLFRHDLVSDSYFQTGS
jgi:hypothetical protein